MCSVVLADESATAEARGFEPPVRFKADNSLAVSPIRPLWHASRRLPPIRQRTQGRQAKAKRRCRRPINWSGDRPSASRTGRPARIHPGQDGAGRDQDRQQRDGVRAAAERAGRDREGHRQHQPLSRQRVRRAQGPAGQARRQRSLLTRAFLRRLRVGQPVPAADPDHLDRRRRGVVRLAQLRDLPAAGAHRRRHAGAGAADRLHLRPRRDARRDHRPHPADLRVQPEQPDQHRRRPRRAGPVRRGGALRHPHRARRGLRRVHPRRVAARQLRPGRASTAMSLCCGPFRRPTGWRGCGSATRSAIRTSSPHWARSTSRSPRPASRRPRPSHRWTPPTSCSRAPTPSSPNAPASPPRLRDAGYTVPPSQANFVWLPLPGRAQEYANASANSRVIVRPYGEDGVRVTVAAPHENDAFLDFAQAGSSRPAAGVGEQPSSARVSGTSTDRRSRHCGPRRDDVLRQPQHVIRTGSGASSTRPARNPKRGPGIRATAPAITGGCFALERHVPSSRACHASSAGRASTTCAPPNRSITLGQLAPAARR